MNHVEPELRDRLAADYAVGTLRGPARKRMRRLMSDDPSLADSVEDWELRLNLLAESAPAVEPPSDLWSKIAARLEPASQVAPSGWLNGLWDSARFWRGIGALAAATAAALGLHVALQSPRLDPDLIAALDERLARIESATRDLAGTPGEIATFATRLSTMESRLNATTLAPSHVAVLIDKYQRPMMTADLNVDAGRLALRLNITPPRDFSGRMLEIWMVQPDGMLRSLGIFPSERSGTTSVLVLMRDTAEALSKGKLEVSLEPTGGSSTGSPSGPVLFSGPVLPVAL